MIGATDFEANLLFNKPTLPKIKSAESNQETEKIARDFTSVFFSEYVNLMFEEIEDTEDDFAMDAYKTMQAQAVGEKLADSEPGLQMRDILIREINRLKGMGHKDEY